MSVVVVGSPLQCSSLLKNNDDNGDDGDNNLEWEVSDLNQPVKHRPLRLLMIMRMAMIMTMMLIMIMVVVMIMMIMMMMMVALAVHSWQITPMSSP